MPLFNEFRLKVAIGELSNGKGDEGRPSVFREGFENKRRGTSGFEQFMKFKGLV